MRKSILNNKKTSLHQLCFPDSIHLGMLQKLWLGIVVISWKVQRSCTQIGGSCILYKHSGGRIFRVTFDINVFLQTCPTIRKTTILHHYKHFRPYLFFHLCGGAISHNNYKGGRRFGTVWKAEIGMPSRGNWTVLYIKY